MYGLTSGSLLISSCKQRIRWMISFAMIYAGAAFAPKIACDRALRLLPALIFRYGNDVKCVQLLTFVLMKTFDLDIKD